MNAQRLFPGDLSALHEATRRMVLSLGEDIIEEFARTQVSYGCIRKFAWLTPLTKTKALLALDL